MKTLKHWDTGSNFWVCEQHPNTVWPHDECIGPGRKPSDEQWELFCSLLKEGILHDI